MLKLDSVKALVLHKLGSDHNQFYEIQKVYILCMDRENTWLSFRWVD